MTRLYGSDDLFPDDREHAYHPYQSFFRLAIAFRKAHPSLGRSRFWRADVQWHGVGPAPDLSYESRSLAFCLRGASQGDRDLYVMISACREPLAFAIQDARAERWARVIDTSREAPDDFCEAGHEGRIDSLTYVAAPRSIVVLIAR